MITVVIPVHNRESLVQKTLQSIDSQIMQPRKVVVVDNASTDSTLEVVRHWAKRHPHAVVVTESTPGAAAARNRGLREVDTDYVMFFDSDDIMPPTHIRDICRELTRTGFPQIGAFDAEIHALDGRILRRPYRTDSSPLFAHIFHGCLATQRMVISTKLLNRVGGWNESLPAWNDYELGVRLLAAGVTPTYLKLSAPVEIISTEASITGTSFSAKAGEWERSLCAAESALRDSGMASAARLMDYRRAILAGHYLREGHRELAGELLRQVSHHRMLMKIIAAYVARGGRGVAEIARIIR